MTEEIKLNLHQKLVEVRKSIDGFTKDKDSYKYSYVSGTQVLAKIINKMNELNLILYPSVTTQTHEIFPYKDKNNKDKQDFLVYGDMSYQWVNADKPEEILVIPWKYTGQQDEISKAFGSGLTYSERYFLLKFFGVPTDADDPDAKPNKGGQQNSQPPNNNYNNNTNKPTSGNNSTSNNISEGQVKAVNTNISILSKLANTNSGKLIERLEKEVGQFGSVTGMSKSQATKSITLLKQWADTTKAKQGESQ